MLKQDFINDFHDNGEPVTTIVTAIKLPTGAVEVAINTAEIQSKFEYICNAYDDEMRLKSNPDIQIVRWFFV